MKEHNLPIVQNKLNYNIARLPTPSAKKPSVGLTAQKPFTFETNKRALLNSTVASDQYETLQERVKKSFILRDSEKKPSTPRQLTRPISMVFATEQRNLIKDSNEVASFEAKPFKARPVLKDCFNQPRQQRP